MDVLVLLCSKALGFVCSKPGFLPQKKKKKFPYPYFNIELFFFFSFVHDKKKSIIFLSQNTNTKLQTVKQIKIKQDN